jgi:hypothetical protein
MIEIFKGTLNDEAQLNNEVILTTQDQIALCNAIINGVAVLRVKCGKVTGDPHATLGQIDCSYHQFDNTYILWRPAEALTMGTSPTGGTTGDLGEYVECMGPQISAPCLACFPTIIRLIWSDVKLDASNYIEDFELGIMLSNAMR